MQKNLNFQILYMYFVLNKYNLNGNHSKTSDAYKLWTDINRLYLKES